MQGIDIKEIVDLHAHIVPNIDDGAKSYEESIEMLRALIDKGVTDLFCTSHNGYSIEDGQKYKENYEKLMKLSQEENLNIRLHTGSEILMAGEYIDDILYGLEIGAFYTLGKSNYVLTEFYCDVMDDEAMLIVSKLLDKGYKPIIAHMERNYKLGEDAVRKLIELGALIQVNAFSFVEEADILVKFKVRNLLDKRLIHFIGSDAHGINHRPPNMSLGVQYIIDNVELDYAMDILNRNAKRFFDKKNID